MSELWILGQPFLLLAISVVVILLLLFKRLKIAAVVLLFAVALNLYYEVFGLYLFASNGNRARLTVLTYNMHSSSDYMVMCQNNPKEMLEMLNGHDADIICLQEYDTLICKRLSERLQEQYPFFAKMPKRFKDCAVFARLPISEVTQIEKKLILRMKVKLEDDSLALYVCHFPSNWSEGILKSVNDSAELKEKAKETLYGIREAGNQRNEYAEVIRNDVDSCVTLGFPVMICGDLNDVNGSESLSILQGEELLKDAWWEKGLGFGFTYHGRWWMRFRLDHILYSDKLKCRSVKVVSQEFSDHDPVVATFSLNDERE